MRGPSGPVSCTRMRICARVCVCACACVRACVYVRVCAYLYVCVRAHTCVCVFSMCVCVHVVCVCVCVYGCVRTCVYLRALCTCPCVCVCVRTCVRAGTCARANVVRANACKGIEDALPLGDLSPQERASLPSCLSTLGALRGGLGGFPGLSMFNFNYLTPMRALQGPCHLIIKMLPTQREGVRNVCGTQWYAAYTVV